MRILVIEDDKETASYMVKGLSEHGHVADHVHDAESGLVMAETGYDVIVLDACFLEWMACKQPKT